jgi:fumarate reductase subunit D
VAIAKKALVWSLFAAGGTVTAFVFPALIALFLMVSLGYVPGGLSHAGISAFAASWIGKIILFGVLFFSIWHAAHRMRVIFHDFGVRADSIIASTLYLLATLATVLAAAYLWNIR